MSVQSISSFKLVKETANSKVGVTFKNDDEGNLRVAKLAPNGLAATNGLKVDDIVTEINGIEVSTTHKYIAAKMVREAEGDLNIVTSNYSMGEGSSEFHTDVEERYETAPPKLMQLMIHDEALLNMYPLSFILVSLQIFVAVCLFCQFSYDDLKSFTIDKYVIYRDIMVMLLLGFGYLMTFLEKYGLGAVGLTMLLTVVNMECNLLFEGWFTGSTSISMDSLINAEFSAAALLISFGALIGRASPIEMCMVSIAQAFFYALNKVFIVFGFLQAEDVGGTITIHMFGAYFGLACAYALGPQEKVSVSNNATTRVSDVFSLLGTTLLWVYWPSFVGATETDVAGNEFLCTTNTIMSLVGSTGATFFWSQYLNNGKIDVVHIQNSTLAGGVAIGASARMTGPGTALLVGLFAGTASVYGYDYSSPFLEERFGIYDTCGVGNLHGYPSIVGALFSAIIVVLNSQASFLEHGIQIQYLIQLLAIGFTLLVSTASGYFTGSWFVGKAENFNFIIDYDDAVWWLDVE